MTWLFQETHRWKFQATMVLGPGVRAHVPPPPLTPPATYTLSLRLLAGRRVQAEEVQVQAKQ